MRTVIVRTGALAALLAILRAEPAQAEPEANAPKPSAQMAAEALFVEGVNLMKADRCEEALAKFAESQGLDPASGTLLDAAYCEARLGRVASAWLDYRRTIPLARARDKLQHERLARAGADRLEPELPRISITLAGSTKREIVVTLDGEPLATRAVSFPIDPGSHVVRATLEGGRPWEQTITIARAERAVIEVPLGDAAPAAPLAPSPPMNAPSSPSSAAPGHPTADRPLLALGLGTLGAGALIAGSVLFVSARVQYDNATKACSSDHVCPLRSYNDMEAAIARANLSLGLATAGLIAGGLGTYFYLSDGQRRSAPSTSAVASVRGTKDWWLALRGTW